ncbi:MAG: hypothetical protein ABUL44_04745 [Flavobacterium sp.]
MKPKTILSSLGYLAIASILFTSCYPGTIVNDPYIVDQDRQKENQYYVQAAPNVPLLTKKNDLSITGMSSSGSKSSGGEVQAAYMPAKHVGIIGGYSFAKNSYYAKYNRFELGSGYVTALSKAWHFETYAGAGSGKISNTHYTGTSVVNLTHFFIQPAIAVSNTKQTVQFAFVSRFEGVNFKVNDASFSADREPYNASAVKSLNDQPFHIMWQPGIMFRFGWQKFLFQTGYSISTDLTNSEVINTKSIFSLGMLFRFNTSKKDPVK